MRIRLALFAGSPVYYQAPPIDVSQPIPGSTSRRSSRRIRERGGRLRTTTTSSVEWGVDPLDGYRSIFLKKAGSNPSGGAILDLRDIDIVGRVWRGRYDVLWLHGYHTLTHLIAAVTQKTRHGALLYREEQTLLNPRPHWKTAIKNVGLRQLFHGSYGLFIGAENRRWFERWGMPAERLFHVPYVVDNDALQRTASELAPRREQLRAELGIEREAGPVILTVGRLIPKKQPVHLLEAFRQVRANRRCTLLVVGSGPLEHELRQKVAAEGISDVVFAGFLDQTQVARAYVAADVFALVSSHEPWGLVVNEAMNFGLPVVVSDKVGCAADLVVDGRNGLVVPHDDLEALIAALDRLVASGDLRMRLGEASRQMISPRTYDVTAAGLVAAVRAAVGESRWALAEAAAGERGAA